MQIIPFKSGLHLIYEKNAGCEGVFVKIQFCAGYFQELPKTGIAHLVEHLVMEAPTKSKSAAEKRALLKKFRQNASTGATSVQYWGLTKKEALLELVQELTDSFTELELTEELLQKNKNIIINEMTVQQHNGIGTDINLLLYSLSKDPHVNQERRFCIDYKDDLDKLTIDDIKKFIQDYYTQDNCSVYVTGNISKRKAKKIIQQTIVSKLPQSSNATIFDVEKDLIIEPCFRLSKPFISDGKSVIMLFFNFKETVFEGKNYKYNRSLNFYSQFLAYLINLRFREELSLCYKTNSCIFEDNVGSIFRITLFGNEQQIPMLLEELVRFVQDLREWKLSEENYHTIQEARMFGENLWIEDLPEICKNNERKYKKYHMDIRLKEKKKISRELDQVPIEEVESMLHQVTLAQPYLLMVTDAPPESFMSYETFCEKLKITK